MKKRNNWLAGYKKNITSQAGEDGIIEKVFEVLGITTGFFVDVGAWGMHKSNTYSLIKKGWTGVFIDRNKRFVHRIKKMYRLEGWGDRAYCVYQTVAVAGIKRLDKILNNKPVPKDFDFLSIDIDGDDFYVWKSLVGYQPKVVVVEFNPVCGLDNYVQPIGGAGGASLSLLIKLGKVKGYELIATTNLNAFFVRRDLFPKFEIINNSIEELFIENTVRYGKDTKNYATT